MGVAQYAGGEENRTHSTKKACSMQTGQGSEEATSKRVTLTGTEDAEVVLRARGAQEPRDGGGR